MDKLKFDKVKLGRAAVLKGLLRGEVTTAAGLSTATGCSAFQGRPIGVRSARQIARVLGQPLPDLLVDEVEATETPEAVSA